MNTTIIYYTSNREDEALEQKIRDNILKVCGDTAIISVSHKPIDFGYNICVGEKEACNHNLFRQIEIGAKIAESDFVTFAEADCLYTKEYFAYIPDNINQTYKCDNNYILNEWGKNQYAGFYQKEVGTFSQVTGREYLLQEIKEILEGRPYWDRRRKGKPLELFRYKRWELFHLDNPIVSLKTGKGMSKHTKIVEPPVDDIPYWGNCHDLRREMFYE